MFAFGLMDSNDWCDGHTHVMQHTSDTGSHETFDDTVVVMLAECMISGPRSTVVKKVQTNSFRRDFVCFYFKTITFRL